MCAFWLEYEVLTGKKTWVAQPLKESWKHNPEFISHTLWEFIGLSNRVHLVCHKVKPAHGWFSSCMCQHYCNLWATDGPGVPLLTWTSLRNPTLCVMCCGYLHLTSPKLHTETEISVNVEDSRNRPFCNKRPALEGRGRTTADAWGFRKADFQKWTTQ